MRPGQLSIIWLLAGLLAACSSTAQPATPTAVQPAESLITPAATVVAIAAQPTSTDTPLPAPTTIPTAAATATPTPPPPAAPELRQLTQDGCCVQPFFSPDSQQVLFIDKPDPEAPAGIYGVDLANPQAAPILVDDVIGFRSPDRTIVATMDGDLARFVNETTGESWAVDTGGNWPRYSPDGQQILWEARDQEGPYDLRQTDIWLADLRGDNPRLAATVTGGGFVGWLPDSRRIVLVTREVQGEEAQTLSVLDVTTGQQTNLVRDKRIRGIDISPDGSWIVYYVTFSDTPGNSGIWVANPEGTVVQKLNVPAFGAYHWRNDTSLIFIPMRESAEESMQLWQVDVVTNESRPLTDSNSLVFSISNGDWTVAPDGSSVIFINSVDQNIWLIALDNP